ncbi:MAG: glycosyltransferase [Ferruginibacter sp.]
MRSVYYIIPTTGIGGAEKRFIELWCYLQKNKDPFDFHLVISEQLYEALKAIPELHKVLQPWANKIITYNIDMKGSILQSQKELYRFVCRQTTPNDILHFILSFPTFIFPLKHKRTIYSLTESSLKNVNIKGRLLYLLNVLRAKYIDILDPVVHKKAWQYFFFKKNNILLTPGSFVDTTVFKPVNDQQKENWFVFLGRFFFVKQVVVLLKTLPEVCKRLDDSGIKNYKFIFLGFGQQEHEINSIMALPEYRELPIEIKMTNDPEEILAKSKIIFSLQLHNNYPSKSLLEGMAAGNIPLVTDVGTTRSIASPEFSYYVPEHFSANDITIQLTMILSLDERSMQFKMKAARDFVTENFNIKTSAVHYINLYKKLI